MYDNIGSKIKKLATVIFVIIAIATFIVGFVIGSNNAPIIGFIVMIAGPVLAWVSSFVLYGFGELIDKVCAIERNTRKDNWEPEAPPKSNSTRISEIEKLHSQGLISDDEYQQAISKIQ